MNINMDKLMDINIIPLEKILLARERAPKEILNTPLVKLNCNVPNKEIYLKLENLQPVGSFKIRGAYNVLANLNKEEIKEGVYTTSTGNFATGLSWCAKRLNIPCDVIVPDTCPIIKKNAIKCYGSNLIELPNAEWWNILISGNKCERSGLLYVHPSCHPNAIAGNGVIGLEIIDVLPDVDTIVCPYGGGGNTAGIASAVKQRKPNVNVYACEVEDAAPLVASLKAGKPIVLSDEEFTQTFAEGINCKLMMPCLWNLINNVLYGAISTSLREICDALKLLIVKNHIVAEGAGAAAVAAAMSDRIPDGKIVCIISGGNIDIEKIGIILQGGIPK